MSPYLVGQAIVALDWKLPIVAKYAYIRYAVPVNVEIINCTRGIHVTPTRERRGKLNVWPRQ